MSGMQQEGALKGALFILKRQRSVWIGEKTESEVELAKRDAYEDRNRDSDNTFN